MFGNCFFFLFVEVSHFLSHAMRSRFWCATDMAVYSLFWLNYSISKMITSTWIAITFATNSENIQSHVCKWREITTITITTTNTYSVTYIILRSQNLYICDESKQKKCGIYFQSKFTADPPPKQWLFFLPKLALLKTRPNPLPNLHDGINRHA